MSDEVAVIDRNHRPSVSSSLTTILTIGVGVLVADLYYAQPLVASIAPEIGVSPDLAGPIVSATQIVMKSVILTKPPLRRCH